MENFKQIKKEIERFFQKTKLDIKLEVFNPEDSTIPIKIRTEEPKVLIGQNGQTLSEIQRLLKVVLRKNFPEERFFINLDVNNYKEKKVEYLRETARSMADEVVLTGKEKKLEPMPAYERRIIHLELAERGNVTTESAGEEPERGVIIKPS